MQTLIQIDKNFPDCTAIDTEAWLEAILGRPVGIGPVEFQDKLATRWLVECEEDILAVLEEETGLEYKSTSLDNVYNNENDFSSVFQWQVFYPADHNDWIYADSVYVAIEIHLGGDVRGNYGPVRLYEANYLGDSGFLDWVLGWHVTYSNGEEVPENDRFSIGYSSHPYTELVDHLKGGLRWSEKRQCFVGVYHDGRCVECSPYLYIS